MKKIHLSDIILTAILFCGSTLMAQSEKACTIISLKTASGNFIGNNEDALNPVTYLWFIPPGHGTYGRVGFGFNPEKKTAENGINDQGLYVGVNTVDETNWVPDPGKPDWETWEGWFGSGVPDGILAKCATVEEALPLFEKYNLLTFKSVKYVLADAGGNSAIVEWSEDGLKILQRNGDFQISTNFVNSDKPEKDYTCYRYKMAKKILEEDDREQPQQLLREVLSATSFEFNNPTQYSIIADLNTLDLAIYFYHNFEEPYQINLKEELQKGSTTHLLKDLFEHRSYSYFLYENYYRSSQESGKDK